MHSILVEVCTLSHSVTQVVLLISPKLSIFPFKNPDQIVFTAHIFSFISDFNYNYFCRATPISYFTTHATKYCLSSLLAKYISHSHAG